MMKGFIGLGGLASEIGVLRGADSGVEIEELIAGCQTRFYTTRQDASDTISWAKEVGVVYQEGSKVYITPDNPKKAP